MNPESAVHICRSSSSPVGSGNPFEQSVERVEVCRAYMILRQPGFTPAAMLTPEPGIGRGLMPTLFGIILGLFASLALTRSIKGLLFRVTVTDHPTFSCVSLFLTLVAVLAYFVPARRSTRVGRMAALRYE
jgi:hypothetical protein